MKNGLLKYLTMIMTIGLFVFIFIEINHDTIDVMKVSVEDYSGSVEVATLAGGCFWCIEAPFQATEGVIDVVSGYSGGTEENAKYKLVAAGQTMHRESVQVYFDPDIIKYRDILEIFWKQIDPTDAGGQFADRGHQYTTAIYYNSESQHEAAKYSFSKLSENGKFSEPIATQILPFSTFFPAEEYHQDYYKKAKDHYESYKKASGRSDFIEENWAKKAALENSGK